MPRYPLVRKAEPWAQRHNAALAQPSDAEQPWVLWLGALLEPEALRRDQLIETGAQQYRDWYEKRFDSTIEEDYVLGPELQRLCATTDQAERIEALQALLNGETGRLDCGTLWRWLAERGQGQ